MKSIKSFIGGLFVWGALISLVSCSNDAEDLGMYSDEEFHSKVVQIQNKYNSSLKIDESCLRKDDETLTNINEIMRTIENSSFCYELITSEEGGLIAMPILSTTATRSNGVELDSGIYAEILSHSQLPCDLIVSGAWESFEIKPYYSDFRLINISCTGSVTRESVNINGEFMITGYGTYEILRIKSSSSDIFQVNRK